MPDMRDRHHWIAAVYLLLSLSLVSCGGRQPSIANLDLTLNDTKGNEVKLALLKGRPLVINFWSVTCVPCKAEIPQLIALQDRYKDRGLIVVGVAAPYDAGPSVKAFATEHHMSYPVLVAEGHDLLETYGITALPTSLFVRNDGTISQTLVGAGTRDVFEQNVQALLK